MDQFLAHPDRTTPAFQWRKYCKILTTKIRKKLWKTMIWMMKMMMMTMRMDIDMRAGEGETRTWIRAVRSIQLSSN